jgi:hypothetical protein
MKHAARLPWLFGGVAALGAAFALGACSGRIGDPPGTFREAEGPLCTGVVPGKSPIRRMTRFEYNNTVRDLLGDDTRPASVFVPEEEAMGFDNQATALGVTQILAEQYMVASEKISARAALHLGELLPCDPAAIGEDECAESFVETFGRRAWRRPLEEDEIARLLKVFAWGRAEEGFSKGIQLVIQAMLQSPHFLYRVEFGMPDPVQDDVVPLSHHEVASRLSYMLWASMPDDELFQAAEEGKLGSRDEVAAQARRMLDDPRARAAIANFHTQWLTLGKIDTINKDASAYPKYYENLRPLWKQETLSFLDHVVFDGEGDVASMFTAPFTMLNEELATFYGVDGPSSQAFERVDLDPSRHAGLLTQASILAATGKPNQSSPVHRGKFVRERLLCQILPPPPNNAAFEAPDVKPNATTRERFAEHSENPACAGCHVKMDPVGFGFEHYDGIGLWRDTDQGLPIDDVGELVDTRGIDGPFHGVTGLAHKLAQSEEVRQCVATQWFRFGYGRVEGEDDRCAMDQVQKAFAASGFNVKELLVALTQTDAFRYRRAVVAAAP